MKLQTLSESCRGAGSHIFNCLLSLYGKSGSDSTGSVQCFFCLFFFFQDGAIIAEECEECEECVECVECGECGEEGERL